MTIISHRINCKGSTQNLAPCFLSDLIAYFSPVASLHYWHTSLVAPTRQGSFRVYTGYSPGLKCSSRHAPMVNSQHPSSACLNVPFSMSSNLTTLFKLQTRPALYTSFKNLHSLQSTPHYLFSHYLPPFTYNSVLILFIVHSLSTTVRM